MTPPSQQASPFSLAEGYEVADLLHKQKVAAGAKQVGVKLGFTNQAIWQLVGLDQPFWSAIYDDTVTGAHAVSLEGFVAPRIEPEIVLGTRVALRSGASTEEIAAALDWASAGFEIVHCHYPDWIMSPADAIADAGLHGTLVIGDRIEMLPESSKALASAVVRLRRCGDVVATGHGSDALGGPLEAVRWLLQLPGMDGLHAGSIVTTGTLTSAFPVHSGERWRSEICCPVDLAPLEITLA
jgi:2-oxo-3-hexenedioate decarboxylase